MDLGRLNLDSSGLRALPGAGVKIVVPLIVQGKLIGILNLGPRLSEQDYSDDDQATPAAAARVQRSAQARARCRGWSTECQR